MLQTVSLLPERTVLDNAKLGAYLDGVSDDEAEGLAHSALTAMGLAHRARDYARVLSGGEAQRVAIARALSSTRPLLFADEPTGQLDAANTDRVLGAMFDATDRTLVLVTHDEEAAARCDIILRLADGRLHTDPVRASV